MKKERIGSKEVEPGEYPCPKCKLTERECIHNAAWRHCSPYRIWLRHTWAETRRRLRRSHPDKGADQR